MPDLYFLVGDFESEKAGSLVRKLISNGVQIEVHRINTPDEAISLRERDIENFPCLIADGKKYSGLEGIKRYIRLKHRNLKTLTVIYR